MLLNVTMEEDAEPEKNVESKWGIFWNKGMETKGLGRGDADSHGIQTNQCIFEKHASVVDMWKYLLTSRETRMIGAGKVGKVLGDM